MAELKCGECGGPINAELGTNAYCQYCEQVMCDACNRKHDRKACAAKHKSK